MNLFDVRSQNQKSFDGKADHQHALSGQPYNQTQQFFLLRLMHLLDLRKERADVNGDWQSKLLDRAIYSTFVDCLEQSVGDDARSLLHQQEAAKQG